MDTTAKLDPAKLFELIGRQTVASHVQQSRIAQLESELKMARQQVGEMAAQLIEKREAEANGTELVHH